MAVDGESVGTYLLDDPHVRGVVVHLRDITERKEAEERLRLQAQRSGAVGESVIALDADGRVLLLEQGGGGYVRLVRPGGDGPPPQGDGRPRRPRSVWPRRLWWR